MREIGTNADTFGTKRSYDAPANHALVILEFILKHR